MSGSSFDGRRPPSLTTPGAWFRRFQPPALANPDPEGAGRRPGAIDRRLICFPHAGGAASFYARTARAMAPYADVMVVQYPGRHDRLSERCLPSITALADHIHAAMTDWPAGPVTLFGHSMGAIVAYEVARRLRRPDLHLVVSGHRAPHLPRPGGRDLGDDAALLSHVRSLGGTAGVLLDDPEARELFLPALRADYEAVGTYEWLPDDQPPPGPITALTGEQDPYAAPDEVRAWQRHSQPPFTLEVLPGGHFYLIEQAPAVHRILRTVLMG